MNDFDLIRKIMNSEIVSYLLPGEFFTFQLWPALHNKIAVFIKIEKLHLTDFICSPQRKGMQKWNSQQDLFKYHTQNCSNSKSKKSSWQRISASRAWLKTLYIQCRVETTVFGIQTFCFTYWFMTTRLQISWLHVRFFIK